MKKTYYLYIICLSVVSFISCSKDNDEEENYQLNKLEYDGKLYSLDNIELRENAYFILGSGDAYCGQLEDPELRRLALYFYFTDISNDNLRILPSLTLNLIIPKKNLVDRRPLTIEFNSCQNLCDCSSFTYWEVIYNTTTHQSERNYNASVKGKIRVISLEQPFIKIKFEGTLENNKKIKGYYEGYLL